MGFKAYMGIMLNRVVQKPVNVNPGLNANCSIMFSCFKMFFTSNVFCSLRCYSLSLQGKQYKHNISPKSYKTEIKIPANPGFSLMRLWTKQPRPKLKASKLYARVVL